MPKPPIRSAEMPLDQLKAVEISEPARIPKKLIHAFVDIAHDASRIPELTAMLEAYPALFNMPPGKDKETAMGGHTPP